MDYLPLSLTELLNTLHQKDTKIITIEDFLNMTEFEYEKVISAGYYIYDLRGILSETNDRLYFVRNNYGN